jgi:hypothetical protein
MATTASGPTLAGGTQPISNAGYELLYLPDVNNDALQREGKPPVFYYLPNYVHTARKNGKPDGDFMFNLIRFAGVQSADSAVGAEGNREVAGGVLTFTVSSAPPDEVLKQSQDQIIGMYRAKNDFFWGIRGNATPWFRPVPIVSNVTAVSNVSPLPDGSVPSIAPDETPRVGRGRSIRAVSATAPRAPLPRTWPAGRDVRLRSNLDAWFWRMQGQGNGSIDPMGQNAFSALVGAYPAAILWQAFHGASSPVVVIQALKIKMWAPLVEIRIRGNWSRIFDHFSAAVNAHYLWASVDIKREVNNMRMNGTIDVEVLVDPTIPGAQLIQETVDKKTDLVYTKFMEAAKTVIFDPPMPQVPPAQASSGGWLWGGGLALKSRHDTTTLTLDYHEKRIQAYLQDTTISSSLEGMYDEMKQDAGAEKKYFLSVYLDDWPRKLGRIIKPVVNWPKPEQNWAGEPVAFVSCQVGYPNTQGDLMWTGHSFQKTDPPDATWQIGITQKEQSDVSNPPAGWTPDKTFIKRRVHLLEPPNAQENPFVRVQVDKNTVDLDPEPNGTPMNDVNIEVRADSAGSLSVGPIGLNVELENSKQTVEVTFEPTDVQGNSMNREAVKFSWSFEDQVQPRFWAIFTADPNARPYYRYKVRVVVKGSITSAGMQWEGPWVAGVGNGPLMISVPTQDAPGVVVRQLPSFADIAPAAPTVFAPVPPPAVRARGGARNLGAATSEPKELEVSGWQVGTTRTGGEPRLIPPATESARRQPAHGNGSELEVTGWREG